MQALCFIILAQENGLVMFFVLLFFAFILVMFIALVISGIRMASKTSSSIGNSGLVRNIRFGKGFNFIVDQYLFDFIYYRKLSPKGKEDFIDRVIFHYSKNKVQGAEGYLPDEKMEILVSATAAQLTFYLDKEWLAGFDTVELHPTIFKMRSDGPLMKGATTPNGIIRISVKDYLEGYKNSTDKLNVGLHEFAHALLIEYSASALDHEDIHAMVYPYEMAAKKEIAEGYEAGHFLRKYAFTNKHEFFAVSVETFFEAPVEFAQQFPDLYEIISRLLNQDPRNVAGDYRRRGASYTTTD